MEKKKKKSRKVSPLVHVEAWRTLKRSDLTSEVMDLTFMENWSIHKPVCFNLQLISSVCWRRRCVCVCVCVCVWCGVCAGSARASLLLFFVELRVQRNSRWPTPCLWSQERTVVFVFTGFSFCNYTVQHKWAPEARWDEWIRRSVGVGRR